MEKTIGSCAGAVHAPLIIAIVVLATFSLGVLGLQTKWQVRVQTQLELDRCVGQAAIELKKSIQRIETLNSNMKSIRKAILLSSAVPKVKALLGVALKLQQSFQEFERLRWNIRRVVKLAKGCIGKKGRIFAVLPSQKWFRLPPDLVGPRPLIWKAGEKRQLRLSASVFSQRSFAEVYFENGWKARWSNW